MCQIKWFGETWGAPINRDDNKVSTPVDGVCLFCNGGIGCVHRGVMIMHHGVATNEYRPAHINCFLESVLGPRKANLVPFGGPGLPPNFQIE